MPHARQRLSLLALGILAPVLAFGAIALSDAPSAEAIDEEPYTVPLENCTVSSTWSLCDDDGGCSVVVQYSCSDGRYTTVYDYEPVTANCDIGFAGFDYCA